MKFFNCNYYFPLWLTSTEAAIADNYVTTECRIILLIVIKRIFGLCEHNTFAEIYAREDCIMHDTVIRNYKRLTY